MGHLFRCVDRAFRQGVLVLPSGRDVVGNSAWTALILGEHRTLTGHKTHGDVFAGELLPAPAGVPGAVSPWGGFLGAQTWLCQHLTPCLNLYCYMPWVGCREKTTQTQMHQHLCDSAGWMGVPMGCFHRLRVSAGALPASGTSHPSSQSHPQPWAWLANRLAL